MVNQIILQIHYLLSQLLLLFLVTPGQTSTPEATDITRTSMQVVWDKPSVDGGSMVTGYYLERRDKKSLRWVKVYKDPIGDTKAKVHHLTEGNEYQYRVCAINKAGEGPYSDVSDFYKAADPVGMYYCIILMKCSLY